MKKASAGVGILLLLLVAAIFGYRAHIMNGLRSEVLSMLSDPQSAQFQNERLFSDWTPDGSAMCGEVNAKNMMGGYVGFRPFKAFPGAAGIESEFEAQFKKDTGLESCGFEKVAKWWHLR